MENHQQTCVLLRSTMAGTAISGSHEIKHDMGSSTHQKIVELTRMRIERDRAAKHARCALLRK